MTGDRWNLLFDLDDTLIHCNKYFDLVIDQFAGLMEMWFASQRLPKDEIKRKQLELDLAGIHVTGFAAERFPESFVETYDHYSSLLGRSPNGEERRRLLQLGYSVYDSEFEPYPDVFSTLAALRDAGHKLSLYTGGDESIQRRKAEKVNLAPFFEERIFVATHKNSESLDSILRHMRLDRSATWMIGNSLRTDIVPAIECGIGAVYIPPLSEWAFDRVDLSFGRAERVIRLDSLRQVPYALARHRSANA